MIKLTKLFKIEKELKGIKVTSFHELFYVSITNSQRTLNNSIFYVNIVYFSPGEKNNQISLKI